MKKFISTIIVLIFILTINLPLVSATTDFTGIPTSGEVPLTVHFSDTSTNSHTGWGWFFGDEDWTVPAWKEMTASAGWSARDSHNSVVLPDSSIVLMGGFDGSFKNDVWRLTKNGATWTQMTGSAGWSARSDFSSVAMPDGSIVLMGGCNGWFSYKNDVWRSTDNGATWTQMTGSAGWSAREYPRTVAMPDGSIVLMGGTDSTGNKNDVWRSTNNGATWMQMTGSAGWSAREQFSSVAMPDGSIVLMGGITNTNGHWEQYNDVWRSTDNGATWKQMTASAGWSYRYDHSSVAMPDGSIVLMGGYGETSGSSYKNDVWRSTDNGVTWKLMTASAGWSTRSEHTSVVQPDGTIVLMGGWNGSYKNDVWRLILTGSSAQRPSHTYTSVGSYSVTLQAHNATGYTCIRKTGYVTVVQKPVINSISPSSGQKGGKYAVTIIGTNFEAGTSTITVSGTGVKVGAYTTRTSTKLVTSFTIATGAAKGARIVTIKNPTTGVTGTKKFTITAGPVISHISPASGLKGKKFEVTITGTNFEALKSTVTVSGTGVKVGPYKNRTKTKIVTFFTISPGAKPGVRIVTVRNPVKRGTGTGKFTVKATTSKNETSMGSINRVVVNNQVLVPLRGNTISYAGLVPNNAPVVSPDILAF